MDDAPPALSYTAHIEKLQEWMLNTASEAGFSPGSRKWCTLGLEDLTTAQVYSNFDNEQINQEFEDEFNLVNGSDGKGTVTNTPIMYLQAESDALDGLAKMFIYRHQPRLKNYRDDMENKNSRVYTSLSLALGRYALLKDVYRG